MSKVRPMREWLWAHEDLFRDLVRVYLGAGLFVKAFWLMTHTDYLSRTPRKLLQLPARRSRRRRSEGPAANASAAGGIRRLARAVKSSKPEA